MPTNKESEQELRKLFMSVCEKHPKKHGYWAIYRFQGEGTFLSMDTWNGSLLYCVGDGVYEYWTGFQGKSWWSWGLNETWSDKKRNDSLYTTPYNVSEWFTTKIKANEERKAHAN